MADTVPRGPSPIPLQAGTTLTDTESRPSPADNHLLITAYSTHPESPLLTVTRRISDSGCNLVDTRLATVGRDKFIDRKSVV